jgi:hypothetical protein
MHKCVLACVGLELIGFKLGWLDFLASVFTGPDFGELDLTWPDLTWPVCAGFALPVVAPVGLGI